MKAYPKISIVTPSFNQEKYLKRALLSVLEQGYPNLEYIVIDGGSTDSSTEIIELVKDRLHYYISEPDEGQSHAINKGFGMASGDILGWVNSDDYLEPGALHKVAMFLSTVDQPAWVVGASRLVNSDGKQLSIRRAKAITETTFYRWTSDWFPQQSTFWNRAMWDRVSPLDENLHYTMDLSLWYRMFGLAKPHQVPDILAAYRYHDQAKCVDQPDAAKCEQKKLVCKC